MRIECEGSAGVINGSDNVKLNGGGGGGGGRAQRILGRQQDPPSRLTLALCVAVRRRLGALSPASHRGSVSGVLAR